MAAAERTLSLLTFQVPAYSSKTPWNWMGKQLMLLPRPCWEGPLISTAPT